MERSKENIKVNTFHYKRLLKTNGTLLRANSSERAIGLGTKGATLLAAGVAVIAVNLHYMQYGKKLPVSHCIERSKIDNNSEVHRLP